jgi:hypothetical protein
MEPGRGTWEVARIDIRKSEGCASGELSGGGGNEETRNKVGSTRGGMDGSVVEPTNENIALWWMSAD